MKGRSAAADKVRGAPEKRRRRVREKFSTCKKPAWNKHFFAVAVRVESTPRCAGARMVHVAQSASRHRNARSIGVSGVNLFFRRFAVFFISL
jgi:hypothetical protein